MIKFYELHFFLRPLSLLAVVWTIGIAPAMAQCGYTIENSATGTLPGGTLKVKSAGSKVQRIKWYKDGMLLYTSEAKMDSIAKQVILGTANGVSNVQVFGFKDTIFVTDWFKHRVWKWWPGAASPQIIIGNGGGTGGTPPTGTNAPSSIAFQTSGTRKMWLSEYDNKRVFEVDLIAGSAVLRLINFAFPGSIAVSGDTLYIPNYNGKALHIAVAGNTAPILYISNANNARDVFIRGGYLYFSYAGTVMRYELGRTTGGVLVAGNGVSGPGLNQINDPHSINVDRLGNVYVVEYENKRVSKWEPGATSGVIVTGKTGTNGQQPGLLENPLRVFISDDGYMYVADKDRVQQFGHTLNDSLPNTVSGVYKAVIDGFDGCLDSVSITLANPSGPAQPGNFLASKTAVCKSESNVEYRINKVSAATNYVWAYTPSTGVTINTLSDTSVSVTFSGSASTGVLSVLAENAHGQSPPREVPVTVNDLPVIGAIAGLSSVCVGGTTTLSTTPTGGIWSSGSAGVASINSTGLVSAISQGTATITYSYTDINSCSASATKSMTVHPLPTVSVNPTGALNICQGDSLLLRATSSGVTYQWQEGSNNVGLGADTFFVTTAGSYTVVVTNTTTQCSTTSSVPTIVTVNSLPSAVVNPNGSIDLCEGDSVMLSATQGASYSYNWKWGGQVVGTSAAYQAKEDGIYTVVVADQNTGCTDSSSDVQIVSHLKPVGWLSPSDTAFCYGSHALLRVSTPDTLLGFTWLRGGNAITGALSDFLDVADEGVYEVVLTRTNLSGCADTTSAALIVVHPLPTPTTTWDGEILYADSGYASYQWNIGSQPLPGATSQSYRPVDDGGYSVTVVDTNGCSEISSILNINKVDVTSVEERISSVIVFPNPTNSHVYIQAQRPVLVTVFDVHGRKVWNGSMVEQIDMSQWVDGAYFLVIVDENGIPLKREAVIKQAQ